VVVALLCFSRFIFQVQPAAACSIEAIAKKSQKDKFIYF